MNICVRMTQTTWHSTVVGTEQQCGTIEVIWWQCQ